MGGAPWAVHHRRCGSELCREPSPLCRKLSLGLHVEMARPPTFPYRSASDDGMAVGYRECRRARESGVIDRMGRVSLGVGSRLQTCSCMRVWYRRTIIVARYEFCPFKLHVSRCHGRRMCASRPCVTRHPLRACRRLLDVTGFDDHARSAMREATPHPRTRAGKPEQNLQFRTSSSTSNNHFKLVYRTVYSRLEAKCPESMS
jgi:hypothetical protein